MLKQALVLGVEVAAMAAFDAGIHGAFGYPGTPSTEGFEKADELIRFEGAARASCRAANEKVALEGGEAFEPCRRALREAGLAVFPSMKAALEGWKVLSHGH